MLRVLRRALHNYQQRPQAAQVQSALQAGLRRSVNKHTAHTLIPSCRSLQTVQNTQACFGRLSLFLR